MTIKELRKKLGLSQDALAAKLGVAPYTVRRWESGKAKPNPLSTKAIQDIENKGRYILSNESCKDVIDHTAIDGLMCEGDCTYCRAYRIDRLYPTK